MNEVDWHGGCVNLDKIDPETRGATDGIRRFDPIDYDIEPDDMESDDIIYAAEKPWTPTKWLRD